MTSGWILLGVSGIAAAAATHPLNADDCVAIALERSAQIKAAHADVAVYRAKADQVAALLSLKIQGLGYVTPMFRASGGFGLPKSYDSDLTQWGPYAHGDAQIILPLSTFGRYTAGLTAAEERVRVEEERAREVTNQVRYEIRRLYGLRLYALSLKPNLESALEILEEAITKADELFAKQTGDVTVADRMKLRFGAGEVRRYLRMADDGAELATLALKQAMGYRLEDPIELADERLEPQDPEIGPDDLESLVTEARRDRPEMGQLEHGRLAAEAWQLAEQRSYLPILFAALVGQRDWSSVRPTGYSAVGYNLYNDWFVGLAVGLKLDIDLAMMAAKADEAQATREWVAALDERAATGIPLQVKKAHQELLQHHALSEVAADEVKHTRKWMMFSAAAYAGGTGEAKDVLEGVGSYLMAKKNYYDHLLGSWQAQAELEQVTGKR